MITIWCAVQAYGADPGPGYELMSWNQYNGKAKDRGTAKCKIEVFNGVSTIWKLDQVALPWESGSDTKATVQIPALPVSIERIRITVTETIGSGGGLAEIQLLQAGQNIARQAKATASAVYKNEKQFDAEKVNDGIVSSKNKGVGYWLLPDGKTGWVELRFNRK